MEDSIACFCAYAYLFFKGFKSSSQWFFKWLSSREFNPRQRETRCRLSFFCLSSIAFFGFRLIIYFNSAHGASGKEPLLHSDTACYSTYTYFYFNFCIRPYVSALCLEKSIPIFEANLVKLSLRTACKE